MHIDNVAGGKIYFGAGKVEQRVPRGVRLWPGAIRITR